MTLTEIEHAIRHGEFEPREFDDTLRREIWERDDGKCVYCGSPASSVSHHVHRRGGGRKTANNPANLVLACTDCHNAVDYKKHPYIIVNAFDPDAGHLDVHLCLHFDRGQVRCTSFVRFEPAHPAYRNASIR